MHREERDVDAHEEHPEVDLAEELGILAATHLADPEVEARKIPKPAAIAIT
jgi:hypothetical protein